ncbi:AtpZ/AtpI family protein [Rhizobium sp. 9140]|uniref:AtpZ/AtpI family protein n=1 Tax=Rhizobium sp. 9140 TaxID=1761900 RepID=UPI000791B482|nr:AtpZ/AtpI family protein [Rhizobium sp. 9140]CZT34369.1 ATP synthase protein I [Rhizobium sp. 9140]
MTDDRNEGLEERRKRLDAQLSERRGHESRDAADEARAASNRKGYQVAIKLSSEFVAAVIVGALLGYLLDTFAGTAPWGMIVLLLLGFCAGVLNVMRSAGMVASPHPADRVGREQGDDNKDGGA